MALIEKLQNDLKESMKAGKAERVLLLRGLIAAIHNQEIQKKTSGKTDPITGEEETQVLKREAKKRKEAAELMRSGGREELAAKEEAELSMMKDYLPEELSREQILEVVKKVHQSGISDFSSLMRESMKELKGQADGQLVSQIVKEELGQN